MASCPDGVEHESSAKRIKLSSTAADLCDGRYFYGFCGGGTTPTDSCEGASADCDSGYEASTFGSITTPHQLSPHTDSGEVPDNFSSLSESQTPTHTDHLDSTQDSIDVDDDDNASTVSHLSKISGLSDLSGQDWKPMTGSMIWIQRQMQNGADPRSLLTDLGVDLEKIPSYVDEITLWKLIINMVSEPPRRNKLRHVNTLDDVVRLLRGAQNIIVLTGAGVSVSCGIPDFRSRDGIYSRLAVDFPNLPDPQAMFDITFFNQDPRPFYKFAKDIYPGKFTPSPCHKFIKLLEKQKKLLRNYTQNIDTLEKEAGIERVVECHGSFATATCTKCKHKVTAEEIREVVLEQKIPLCKICHPEKRFVSTEEFQEENVDIVASGVMKPDIVFFGEGLPDTFHDAMAEDKSKCDLLLVIGSSLKVRPVALIPSSLPPEVPQILINREPLNHCHFDVELLGDCDVIINHLCQLLGSNWKEGVYSSQVLRESAFLPLVEESESDRNDTGNDTDPDPEIKPEEAVNEEVCRCIEGKSEREELCPVCQRLQNKDYSCLDIKSYKERHMSIDSARDSGIGENSNFTDVETKYDESDSEFRLELATEGSSKDLRGFWQPKIKKNLVDRLPPNSFHLLPPSRYIFPGAEVYYDPDEKLSYDSSSDSSDSESEAEASPFGNY